MFIQEKNPYDCSTCRKSFTKPAHLKELMLVHKGDKPYYREACSEGLVCFSNFIKQKRVHTWRKPNTCDLHCTCITNSSDSKIHKRQKSRIFVVYVVDALLIHLI